jgi:hypothetical protein
VLGVKSNNTELSLMLHVRELYFMADQIARSIDGVCTLEEPLESEDDTDRLSLCVLLVCCDILYYV